MVYRWKGVMLVDVDGNLLCRKK